MIPPRPFLYLASQSPRRQALLTQLGIDYEVIAVAVDETPASHKTPPDHVTAIALQKAHAGWQQLLRQPAARPAPVLGADTDVVLDGQLLGKPIDRTHAIEMLQRLSGRVHHVMSAVALVQQDRAQTAVQISQVRFRRLTAAECAAYWATGEPVDKAGGYAIQGRAAAFIAELTGSYSGVMGLPLFETAQLLGEWGFDLWRMPTPAPNPSQPDPPLGVD